MARHFIQAQYIYGARDPRVVDLFSLEETGDESVLVLPYIPPEYRPPSADNGIELQRCTVHYGTKSADYSLINFHRRTKGEVEITGRSLTSAIKKGGWANVISVMQAYRSSETGNTSQSDGERHLLFQSDVAHGQIIYHIAVGAKGSIFVSNSDLDNSIGPSYCIDLGNFTFLVFVTQTQLPMTRQGFTLASKTLPPEDLPADDERLMRLAIEGQSEGELIAHLSATQAALVYHLCAKIELYPSDGYFLWTNLKQSKTVLEAAKAEARRILTLAERLHEIDAGEQHPISVLSSADLQIKYSKIY